MTLKWNPGLELERDARQTLQRWAAGCLEGNPGEWEGALAGLDSAFFVQSRSLDELWTTVEAVTGCTQADLVDRLVAGMDASSQSLTLGGAWAQFLERGDKALQRVYAKHGGTGWWTVSGTRRPVRADTLAEILFRLGAIRENTFQLRLVWPKLLLERDGATVTLIAS